MAEDTLKAFEAAVAAEANAKRKLEQARKDLAFHERKVPRMQEAYDAAVKASLVARNALTAPATPAKAVK